LKQIEEPSRSIPVMAEIDVLVVSGGPGGLSAALAAAREGVDTMLLERYGCFGGVITQAPG
jgi:ribulose 1,5-bisphosphate synthetase/thiazole synthase